MRRCSFRSVFLSFVSIFCILGSHVYAQSSALDGIYVLTTLGDQAPPVRTPSSYGTIRGATMAIKGERYALIYYYGSNQKLEIEGTITTDARLTRVTFNPTTAGVVGATAARVGRDFTMVIDGAFGIPNARLDFTYKQALPAADPQADTETVAETPGTSDSSCPAARGGNLVEPLSNGLALHWSLNDIKEKFGEGSPSWDSRTITYPAFRVAVGGGEEKIWHLHLTSRGVCLNSGITYGSSKADVQRVFGKTYGTTYDQYKLTFQYDGDRLVDIGIDPAGDDFAPYKSSAKPAQRTSSNTDAKPIGTTSSKPASILGKWWGVQSMTQIDVKPDGTYTSPNGGKGTWRMTGDEIVFTGALAGWNHGRAKLTKGGWIEFLWKDASGAAYLFQLIRR